MNKAFRILEVVWLVMGIIGLFMFVYSMVVGDRTGAIYFLVFFIVCGLMFSVRRKQRRNFAKKMEEEQNRAKK
ncbi:MAG: hypothetical protein WAQ28_13435 [Bacteroidia bacterium]|jgi:hypothetical protein